MFDKWEHTQKKQNSFFLNVNYILIFDKTSSIPFKVAIEANIFVESFTVLFENILMCLL